MDLCFRNNAHAFILHHAATAIIVTSSNIPVHFFFTGTIPVWNSFKICCLYKTKSFSKDYGGAFQGICSQKINVLLNGMQ